MIRYDEHAEFQIARRNIDKAWIEAVLRSPDTVEKGKTRQSFLKCLPVITAYFDRTRPCG